MIAITYFMVCDDDANLDFHFNIEGLESLDNRSNGVIVPIAKTSMVKNAVVKFSPCEARDMAAPRVGPTQGAQTSPRTNPRKNCPYNPLNVDWETSWFRPAVRFDAPAENF